MKIKKDKPLLIHGLPGSGKTHMALKLAKDMVLTKIDSSMLKSIKNKDYLLDIVKKRNVTLMFSNKIERRCLLIDDIHVFQKYDTYFFKSIIEFIKNNQYYHSYIILVCNNSLLKNKGIQKIKKYINTYEIKYTYSQYYKICLELSAKREINLKLDDLDKKIYFSNYNFNHFLSSFNENIQNNKDNQDPIEIITHDLIKNHYKLSELFRICENDEIILSYNLLENIGSIIRYDIKKYHKIYETFVNSDIIEYNLVKYDKECIKYMSILAISYINYFIDDICKNVLMNRYISKCMVLTNIININYLNLNLYLYDSFIKYKDNTYNVESLKLDKKEYNRIIKIYEYFYLGIQ